MKKKNQDTGLVNPPRPSSIEVMQQLGYPINKPKRELITWVHSDQDVETTHEAVSVDEQITAYAKARGAEVDPTLAEEALSGLQHGNSTQSVMARWVEKARVPEAAAAEFARGSVDSAVAAEETAKLRNAAPQEEVTHPTLGRGTRAQFELLHKRLQHAAAVRESAGVYDHHDDPPKKWVFLLVELVVALAEAMLVTRRIANASWASPMTMLLFVALSLITFIFVHFVTHHTGRAIRDYKEARSGAIDLTAVATNDGSVR